MTTIPAAGRDNARWVNVRLPDDLAETLHEQAYKQRRTKTAIVIDALRRAYPNPPQTPAK